MHPSRPLAEVLRRLIAALESAPGTACPVCAGTDLRWLHEPWSGPVCTDCGIEVPQPVLTPAALAKARNAGRRDLASAA